MVRWKPQFKAEAPVLLSFTCRICTNAVFGRRSAGVCCCGLLAALPPPILFLPSLSGISDSICSRDRGGMLTRKIQRRSRGRRKILDAYRRPDLSSAFHFFFFLSYGLNRSLVATQWGDLGSDRGASRSGVPSRGTEN